MNRILFTGASGFLGSNILPLLNKSNKVETLGRGESNDNNCDLSSELPCLKGRYDMILHLAGKAHLVPKTKEEKESFHKVNYQGTVNLCKSLEKTGVPKSFIFISTVAVYGREFGENITEEHPLEGNTPYALSKIRAEQFLSEWCRKNNVILGIIRPSLIAGVNPPGNLGAMINAIKTGRYFSIGGGKAQKSVLIVQDVVNVLPMLAEKGGTYNLCDSPPPSFKELEKLISNQLNRKQPLNIPYWPARLVAIIGDLIGNKFPINSLKLKKITKSLTFSNEKAKRELNWQPLSVIENFKIN